MLERIRRRLAPQDPRALEAGGIAFGDLYPIRRAPLPRTGIRPPGLAVAASTSSQLLAPANAARRSLTIRNDGTGTLYVAYGPLASSANHVYAVAAGATLELEPPDVYLGDVSGLWTAVGAGDVARVTETV